MKFHREKFDYVLVKPYNRWLLYYVIFWLGIILTLTLNELNLLPRRMPPIVTRLINYCRNNVVLTTLTLLVFILAIPDIRRVYSRLRPKK
jgi:hypothetical protein